MEKLDDDLDLTKVGDQDKYKEGLFTLLKSEFIKTRRFPGAFFCLIGADGKPHLNIQIFEGSQEKVKAHKRGMALSLKNTAAKVAAVRYLYVAEAFLTTHDIDTPAKDMKMPYKDPKAISVLMFVDEKVDEASLEVFQIFKGENTVRLENYPKDRKEPMIIKSGSQAALLSSKGALFQNIVFKPEGPAL